MVAAQTVLANLIGAGMEIRNEDAGVVAALAADDLATGQRIYPAETGTVASSRSIQRASNAIICGSQVRTDRQTWSGAVIQCQ